MLPYLKELITTNPFVEEIDLENKGIASLDAHSVDLLGKFQELRKINLSDNHIRKLPNDLSSLHMIQEFNLNGNPLEDLEAAVDSLQTMPNLSALYVNLHEEEQVDYLLRQLQSLEYLNGLAVEREALFNDGEDDEEVVQEEEEELDASNIEQPNQQLIEHSFQDPMVKTEDEEYRHQSDQQYNYSDRQSEEGQQEDQEEEQMIYDHQEIQEENEEEVDQISEASPKHESEQKDNKRQQKERSVSERTNDEELNKSQVEEEDGTYDSELKAQDLEGVAILYDQIRSVRRKVEHGIDKRLAEDFDKHLKDIMFNLSQSLQELQQDVREDKEGLKRKVILLTKKSLIDMCLKKAVEYLQKSDNEAHLIFKQLANHQNRQFESAMALVDLGISNSQNLQEERERDKETIQSLQQNVQQSQNQLSGLMKKRESTAVSDKKLEEQNRMKDSMIESLQKTLQQQDQDISQAKKQMSQKDQQINKISIDLDKNQRETAEILEAAETLEKESQKNAQINEDLQASFKEQKEYYENTVRGLEEENKRLLDTLIRHSKGRASANPSQQTSQQNYTQEINQLQPVYSSNNASQQKTQQPFNNIGNQQLSQSNSRPTPQQNNFLKQHNTSTSKQSLQQQPQFLSQPSKGQFGVQSQQNFTAGTIGTQQSSLNMNVGQSSSGKILPLKQLKDVINDIYQQKIKYDIKCRESKLPVETMEQYMYTYLNQKYGLKTLIIEWASTIIHGVRTYLKDDHEVTLFGKILKNECDEEFRFIQMHVKDTLQNLLKILVREKFHLKSEGEIGHMCEAIQNGAIEDWQWKKIVNKMYDSEDVCTLTERFLEVSDLRRSKKENTVGLIGGALKNGARKLSREEEIRQKKQIKQDQKLLYSEFLKIILDFQLHEHEKFLSSFTGIFKSVDGDSNGILDENEFRELILRMEILNSMEEIETLLSAVDPHNNKQMTYSEIVQLLSSQMTSLTETDNRQVPLLEKFVNHMNAGGNYEENQFYQEGEEQYEEEAQQEEWEGQQDFYQNHQQQNQQKQQQFNNFRPKMNQDLAQI